LPVLIFLALAFAAPLLAVLGYSFMPEGTFDFTFPPTIENYHAVFSGSYYISFVKSLGLALVTVALLMVICWPIAYGMAKIFGRWANLMTLAIVIPLFVSENIRLFGWVLFLIKGGVLLGSLQTWLGIDAESILYDVPAIVLGLVYVYLPFTLFPMVLGISMVSREVTEAAFDMGASRWQVFREVELPLAMPGILIGGLLTFILSLGSLAESKILGGQAVIMIADEIETAFTFGQNWPLGSALSVLLILFSGTLVITLLNWVDLDRILGRGGDD
ncbi:MAG TPA: ABC transporter permease, partial [Kiloniellaceae bacterium]|nr:ABC transporter permease [Kiloniellaceae bacterium]